MPERIVVPLDGSAVAEQVLPVVARLALRLGAELTLVRVLEPISAVEVVATAGVVDPDEITLRALEAEQYLAGVQARLAGEGHRVHTLLRKGAPAEEIAAAVREVGADLVAMCTHGRGGLRRAVLGSVAESVLRTAGVPVLLTRAARPPAPSGAAP